MSRTRDYPEGILSPQPATTQAAQPQPLSETTDSVLAECLALLAQNDPDFATVAEAWSDLPEPVRAGIVAMVKAARP